MSKNRSNENMNNQESQVERIEYEHPEVENEPSKKLMVIAVMVLCLVVFVMVGLSFLGKNREANDAVKSQVQQIGTEVKNKNFELPQQEVSQKNFQEFQTAPAPQQTPVQATSKPDPLSNTTVVQKTIFKPKVFKTGSSLAIATSSSSKKDIYVADQNISWAEQAKRFEEDQDYEGNTYTPKIAVTLLIEKGSKIFGSFRSGEMNDGMNRIFVIWSEIRTPNNINIPVQSGASDELGGSGLQGYVDHQWLKRFGASILLSMVDDVFNYSANGKRDNSYDYSENTRDSTQQMANTALEEFIKIKPVLYRNQGDIVGVYVNRDIDFSKVYKLTIGRRK